MHFQGLHLASWTEHPVWFKQADRQAGEDSQTDSFSLVSGGAPGPQQEPALSTPGFSSALILRPAALPLWAQESHQLPQVDLTTLPLLEPDLTQPHPFWQKASSSSLDSSVRPGPGPRLVTATVLSQSRWPGEIEHTDWPGPDHVTVLSRTPVSCSPCASGGDSAMPQEQG